MRLCLPSPFAALTVRLFGLAVAALAALSPITSRAQTGSTDPTFGATFRGGSTFLASAIQPDGRVVIGGDFTTVNDTARSGIARLNANGSMDATFNVNVSPRIVDCLAVQADGKILIGGRFTSVNGTLGINRIARLNADGSLDTSFNPGGGGADDHVRAMALQADGKILICGDFSNVNGTGRNRLARLNTNGTLDSSFNSATSLFGSVICVAVQEDGKVLVGGFIGGILRMLADGAVDPSFNGGALLPAFGVQCIALQQDGKILFGGEFTNVNGTPRKRIARLTSAGILDSAFSAADAGANAAVGGMAAQADGKILVTGSFTTFNGPARTLIARLNADCTLDNTFVVSPVPGTNTVDVQADGKILLGANGSMRRLENDAAPQTLTAPSNTQVLWLRGGSAAEVAQVSFALSTDGGINFNPLPGTVTRSGSSGWVLNGLSLPANGLLRARGRTTGGRNVGSSGLVETVVSINAPTVSAIAPAIGPAAGGTSVTITGARFTGATAVTFDGTAAASFTVNSATQITAITPAGAAGVVGVRVTTPGTTSAANPLFTYVAPPTVTLSTASLPLDVSRLTIEGTGFSVIPSENVVSFTPTGTGTIIDATPISLTVSGLTGLSPGALNAVVTTNGRSSGAPVQIATLFQPVPGAVDPGYHPDVTSGTNGVMATAVLPDGRTLIAGQFSSVGGESHVNIARINAEGSVDSTFTASANEGINCMAVQADGKIIIGGDFTSINGTTGLNRIARLNANGTLDSTFNPGSGTNGSVNCLAFQADGKILVGGNFSSINGVFFPGGRGVVRLEATGTRDTGFSIPSNIVNTAFSLAVQPDGKILLGGLGNKLARVNANGTLDTGFNSGGSGPDSTVRCLALQADGKILIAGEFAAYNGTARRRLARVNANGTLDTGFFDAAPVTGGPFDQPVKSIAVQADGKIVLGGDFTSIDSTAVRAIARLNTDGRLDSTFLVGTGTNANSVIKTIALQANGGILVGGSLLTSINGTSRNGFARLHNNPATQRLSPTSLTAVGWTRGGSSPEISLVTFELSTNGGTSFTALSGTPTRVGTTANWQLSGLSLPASGVLRARGRTTGGERNGSAGLVETVTSYIGLVVPTVTQVAPAVGSTAGGSSVVITGTGCAAVTAVTFGGTAATSFTVNSATQITATTPARAAGAVSVVLTTAAGSSTANSLFTYVLPPTITSSTTNLFITATQLTITGTRFSTTPGQNTVVFSPGGSGTVTASTATSLTVTGITGLAPGPLNAVVTVNNVSSGVPVQVATVVRPTITPSTAGQSVVATSVTITGTEFSPTPGQNTVVFSPAGSGTVTASTATSLTVTGITGLTPGPLNAVVTVNNVGSGPPAQVATIVGPVITPSAANLIVSATQLTITGIGFSPTPGQNTVVFSPGGSGTVTASTTTSLTVTGINGLTLGALSAVVTSRGGGIGSSGTALQVATVVAPGIDGLVTLDLGTNSNKRVSATVEQPDGKVMVAWEASLPAGTNRIARITVGGTLDSGFNLDPALVSGFPIGCMALQPDGRILIGGTGMLARLNANGSLDPTFAPPIPVGGGGQVLGLALQPDGKILFCGAFTSVQVTGEVTTTPRRGIARLNANGTLDAAFDPNPDDGTSVSAMALQPDGKILLGGNFTTFGGLARNRVARVNANGTLDGGFSASLAGTVVNTLALQPDGKILLGGLFTSVGGVPRGNLARINANGTVDTSFQGNMDGMIRSLALQLDGKVLVGGLFTSVFGVFRPGIARVLADGFLETGFIPRAGGTVDSVAVQSNGQILVGGLDLPTMNPTGYASPETVNGLARLAGASTSQILAIPDRSQITWTRSGPGPNVTHVLVQNSIDGGITWNTLGQAARTGTTSNWQLSGLALPLTGQIRVLGRTSGSLFGGSQGLVSAVQSYAFSPPLTPIEIWRQQFFGTTANSGNAADDFDFDKDGLANLVEYAFSLDPTRSSSGQLPEGRIVGPDLVFSFTEPAGVSGITYGAESTTTLQPGDFTPVPDTGVAPGHVFRVPIGTHTRLFMRLKVTRP